MVTQDLKIANIQVDQVYQEKVLIKKHDMTSKEGIQEIAIMLAHM
jgi:hypothetical protein